MKTSELRNLSSQELSQKEQDLHKELFKLEFQRRMGRVEKPHLFKQIKRDIARIKTILNQPSLQKEVINDAKKA